MPSGLIVKDPRITVGPLHPARHRFIDDDFQAGMHLKYGYWAGCHDRLLDHRCSRGPLRFTNRDEHDFP